MKTWMIYEKIQELKRNHLKKSQVSKRLGIDYKTVLKYWDMPPDEFARTRSKSQVRAKKADVYKDYVVACLQKYPDMSAAQIDDWIREKYNVSELPCRERAFRNYINAIRKEYGIEKPSNLRQYEAVDDPPMGKQAQVDMGQIPVDTPGGRKRTVYGFGMVMSNSRQKFILWQLHPWTTDDFIQAHLKAWKFFGGRTKEIVYDQDSVLAVSENSGDIIYTEGFQSFVNTIGFDIYLCHGADPESKGRIENVIKYAKHGFAEHRTLVDIDSFNEDCIAWLNRTGNAKVHGTTKKVPAEVFVLEKEYLIPVPEYGLEDHAEQSITYGVRKDNIVLYRSNRYRVPKGTYKKGLRVFIRVDGGNLSIVDAKTETVYATHPLCRGKGELIGESSRSERDKSKSLMELEDNVKALFGGDQIGPYLDRLHEEKTRYYRDQLGIIRSLFESWDPDLVRRSLDYCIQRSIYSAGELKSTVAYLATVEEEKRHKESGGEVKLPEKYRGGAPEIRDLQEYEQAMERRAVNG